MKTKIKYFIMGFVLCLILSHAYSLIKCEILTHKHYDEFKDAYNQNTMLGDMEYFKVLTYSPYRTYNMAQVYYVSKGHTMGNVLTFIYDYEADSWKELSWTTIWSKNGNASEVIYPYWWHFIYGGF